MTRSCTRKRPSLPCASAQFWLSTHPPARGRGTRFLGSHPAVHSGFLRSWLTNGLNARVIQRIEEILEDAGEAASSARRKVFLTGAPRWCIATMLMKCIIEVL